MLEVAAILCFVIGIIHSYLGERFIIIRLLRKENIPHLFGGTYFTKRTIRFAWHLTTFAWWGFGYLLFEISKENANITQTALFTICAVFLFSGLLAFGFTKGKHLSWVIFWSIAGLSYYAAING